MLADGGGDEAWIVSPRQPPYPAHNGSGDTVEVLVVAHGLGSRDPAMPWKGWWRRSAPSSGRPAALEPRERQIIFAQDDFVAPPRVSPVERVG